ncbi:uncharacterized protein LOC123526282 [Mercenaria mercenaria]|uniref:uncharacterized protein LOC123526282 n=1 Tax=Mercenaria mercenaria TaxID=6596 RepID=UPI00234E9ABC|nr:uncharacterized protein LOC123526282 [Mercenaria mercenaria]
MRIRGHFSRIAQTAILSVVVMVYLCQAGVAGQSTCAKDLAPEPVKETLEDGLSYKDDIVLMCSDGKCEKLSLGNIKNAYPGAFSSKKEAQKSTGLKYNTYVERVPSACALKQPAAASPSAAAQLIRPICRRFWSDRDGCCPTWRYVTFHNGPLKNIFGRRCYILQIPYLRLYQYISVGLCGWPQNCNGRCTQQYTIQSMLAWCPGNGGIRMHHFRIPTYCSCQQVRG